MAIRKKHRENSGIFFNHVVRHPALDLSYNYRFGANQERWSTKQSIWLVRANGCIASCGFLRINILKFLDWNVVISTWGFSVSCVYEELNVLDSCIQYYTWLQVHWEKYMFVMTISGSNGKYFPIDNKHILLITINQIITSERSERIPC